jgi:ABC-type protease/lipase transport system fused ATPase/permease subunit
MHVKGVLAMGAYADAWASGLWRGSVPGAGDTARRQKALAEGHVLLRLLAFSGLLALLHLSTSLYMLSVYDRVLPEGRAADLAALTVLAMLLHVVFAVLDLVRARLVCRAGLGLVDALDGRALEALQADGGRGTVLLDDIECVRRFLISTGPCAVLDVLWLPAFLGAVFFLHPVLGIFASGGVVLLAGLAVATELRKRATETVVARMRLDRYALLREIGAASRSGGEPACCLDAALRWRTLSQSYAAATWTCAERATSVAALAKGLRLMLQSCGFGLGALLVIEGLLSPGALFASSLMMARTFACFDGVLLNWRGLVAARDSYQRLTAVQDSAACAEVRS